MGLVLAVAAEGSVTGAMTKIGFAHRGSKLSLLEGGEMTVMDLDRRLRCLSLNSVLKFVTMSLFSFSSQAIGGTTNSTSVFSLVLAIDQSTPVSCLVLAAERDENGKETKTEGEEEDANGRVCVI